MNLKIATFFGIPLYIHWTWFVFMVLFYVIQPNTFIVLLFAFYFVVLHEYGHALVAKWFNLDVKDVTLYPLGGVARVAFEYNDYREELFVSLAGPLVNVFFAGIFYIAAILTEYPYFVLCFYVNAILVVFNLFLPIIPMDGGRVLRSILHKFLGDFLLATWSSVRFGQILAIGLIFFSVANGLWMWVLIFGFTIFLSQNELLTAQRFKSFNSLRDKLAQVLDTPKFKSANLQETILLLKSLSDEEVEKYCLQDLVVLLEEIKEIET